MVVFPATAHLRMAKRSPDSSGKVKEERVEERVVASRCKSFRCSAAAVTADGIDAADDVIARARSGGSSPRASRVHGPVCRSKRRAGHGGRAEVERNAERAGRTGVMRQC
jgi:hypothetical protein